MKKSSPLINKPVIGALKIYKSCISPFLPRTCRFEPSCSVYARTCYERFGFVKATGLMVKRLLRCNPWGPYGFDPVPEKEKV